MKNSLNWSCMSVSSLIIFKIATVGNHAQTPSFSKMRWGNTLPPRSGTKRAKISDAQDADPDFDADFILDPNFDPNQQQNNQPELYAGADNQLQFEQHVNPFAFDDEFGLQPQGNQQTGLPTYRYPDPEQPQDAAIDPYGGFGGFGKQPPAGPQASTFGVPPGYHPLDPNFANLTYGYGSNSSNFGFTQQGRQQQQQPGTILSLSQAELESIRRASTQQDRPHDLTQPLTSNAFSNWTLGGPSSAGIQSTSQFRSRAPIASGGFQDYQIMNDTEVSARRRAREQAEHPRRTLRSQPSNRNASTIDTGQVPKTQRGRPLGSTKTAAERDAAKKKREIRNPKAQRAPWSTRQASTYISRSQVPESQSDTGAGASLPPRSNQSHSNTSGPKQPGSNPSKKRQRSVFGDSSDDDDDKDGNEAGDEEDPWANREPFRCAPCDKDKKTCSYATKKFPCDRCVAKKREHLCVSSKPGVPKPDCPYKVRKLDGRLFNAAPKKTKTGRIVVKACDNCKKAKSQGNCDNGRPCGQCIRKGLRDTCDASIQNQTYMGQPPVNPMASSSPVASSSGFGRGPPQSNTRASAAPTTSANYHQHPNLSALYRAREGLPASLDPNMPDDNINSDEIATRLENQDRDMRQLHDPHYQPLLTIEDTRSYLDNRNESFASLFANMNRFSRNADFNRNTIQQTHLQPGSQLQQTNYQMSEGLSTLATAPDPEQHHLQRAVDDLGNYDLEGRYEQQPGMNRYGQNTFASPLPQSARRHQQVGLTLGQLQQRRVLSVQEQQIEDERRWQEDRERQSDAGLRQAARRPAQETARGFEGFAGYGYRPAAERNQSLTSAHQQAHQDRLQTAEQEARNAAEANALRQTNNFDPVLRPLFDEANGLLLDPGDAQILMDFHQRNPGLTTRVHGTSSRGTTSTNPLNFEDNGIDDGAGEAGLFMDDPDEFLNFDELEPGPPGTFS